jgi:Na+/H+ antiporter NhaC
MIELMWNVLQWVVLLVFILLIVVLGLGVIGVFLDSGGYDWLKRLFRRKGGKDGD